MKRPSCTGSPVASRAAVSLPVLETAHGPAGTIRKSKNGKRRAIVLALVQAVILLHIVLWLLAREFGWFGGQTLSPIEPSEGMEFSKHGVINAGLIFFLIALLSTVVLGRWFCGWGCHVLLLQDLCAWVMKKMGIRPKPFRSRLLVYVPLLLGLYMFIWPAAYRWGLLPLDAWLAESLGTENWLVTSMRGAFGTFGVQLPLMHVAPWHAQWNVTTDEFWRTFPGVLVAVPFLAICGFATVYFLGSKGFCTYGCPYGGFFAPLSSLAPGNIRVTNDCEQCGHCTAVCTSNVRVHDEVREYGMVVDPGCMKCLDCVSVCPNDALYFGFGTPAVFSGPAKNEKPAKRYDMTWPEEIAIAGVFALVFYAVWGVYGVVPFLMAAGIAGVLAFMTWKLWRMVRDEHVSLHRFRLKYRGALKRSGWVFAGATLLALALAAHSGLVNAFHGAGNRFDENVTIPASMVFAADRTTLTPEMERDARRALHFLQLASSFQHGGIGLLSAGQSEIDFRKAWLHSTLGEFDAAQQHIERMIARDGATESSATSLFRILFAAGKHDEARAHLKRIADQHPEFLSLIFDGAAWLVYEGDSAAALDLTATAHAKLPDDLAAQRLHAWGMIAAGDVEAGVNAALESTKVQSPIEPVFRRNAPEPLYVHLLDRIVTELAGMQRAEAALTLSRAGLAQFPESLYTMRRLSMLEVQFGDAKEGIRLIKRTIEIDPASVGAHYTLALAHASQSQYAEAYDAMKQAMAMHPEPGPPGPWYMQMAEICTLLGRDQEAQQYRAAGERLFNP